MEDNEADAFLIEEAIKMANLPVFLHVARNGEQATQFFDRADRSQDAPCPAVVILDINLPRKPGFEVLRHLRASKRCHDAHVIVVSTSNSPAERGQMADLGANDYFQKPSEFHNFMKLGDLVRSALDGHK